MGRGRKPLKPAPRPLTAMRIETLAAFYYGEVTVKPVHWKGLSHVGFFVGEQNISGRVTLLRKRKPLKRIQYPQINLGVMFVSERGLEELAKHPEI